MIYSVVINPALPTLVYLIPNCCKVLAIVRKMPHKSPAFTFSFQSRGAALSPAIFLLIRIYTRIFGGTDQGTDTVKGERMHIVHALALGDESHAPDGSR